MATLEHIPAIFKLSSVVDNANHLFACTCTAPLLQLAILQAGYTL